MDTDEKMWWHSYVYAWRKIFLNASPHSPPPTDPQGIWYFEDKVNQILKCYHRKPRQERITPAMEAYQKGKYEDAEFFDNQDRERRNFRGSDEDYITLCMKQVKANMDRSVPQKIRYR